MAVRVEEVLDKPSKGLAPWEGHWHRSGWLSADGEVLTRLCSCCFPGSGSQVNGNFRMYGSVGDLRPQALDGDDLDEDIPPPP